MFGVSYIYFYLLLLTMLKWPVHGFPSGPPVSTATCQDLEPSGHFEDSMSLNYTIETSKDWFYPSEIINISISTSGSNELLLRGLMMQVRDSDDAFTGTFMEPDTESGYKLMRCEMLSGFSDRSAGSTVSHSNRLDKKVANFQWSSPASCGASNDYHVLATVVKSFIVFQVGIVKPLECRERPIEVIEPAGSGVAGMELEEEPENPCRFSNVTSLPPDNKYTTSFETRGSTNGWINKGWSSDMTPISRRWRRKSGRTLSRGTGPNSAADGRYYMYFETSLPTSTGDIVALESEKDLRGCFCLKLKHSHNVANGLDHEFRITVGDEEEYMTKTKRKDWRQLNIQVDTQDFVQIRMLGIKGIHFRGDMAIDDVKLEEGWCTDEEES